MASAGRFGAQKSRSRADAQLGFERWASREQDRPRRFPQAPRSRWDSAAKHRMVKKTNSCTSATIGRRRRAANKTYARFSPPVGKRILASVNRWRLALMTAFYNVDGPL